MKSDQNSLTNFQRQSAMCLMELVDEDSQKLINTKGFRERKL